MQQVAPQVYLHAYPSGNVGFVQTGEGVVCIDSPMLPSDIRDWRTRIAAVTQEPIVLLIQTDYDQARVVGQMPAQAIRQAVQSHRGTVPTPKVAEGPEF